MQRSAARRFAGVLFGIALLTLLLSIYVALVYHGDQDLGSGWVTGITFGNWIAGFSVVIALCFVILLILFIVPPQTQQEEMPPGENQLQVACTNCQKAYVINDPGTRPLFHQCPHCSYTNQLEDSPPPAPIEAEADLTQASMAQPQVIERFEDGVTKKFLVLNCGNCKTNFEIPFTEDRPVISTCANCGRRGILN